MTVTVYLPPHLEALVKAAAENSDRQGLAKLHTQGIAPISPRTFEEWPLVWRLVNGRAVTRTRTAMELAYKRFLDAPQYRGGRSKRPADTETPASPAARAGRSQRPKGR